jgi:tight adherence protein B
MLPPLPVLITFLLVFGIITVVYYLAVLRTELTESGALRKRLKTSLPNARLAGVTGGLRREETPFSAIPVVNQVLRAASAVSGPTQRLIDRSGLNLTVGALLLMCLCAGVAGYLLVNTLSHLVLAAAVVGMFLLVTPVWFVSFMAKRRVTKFEEQFPEAIDLLSRALKAGHAFTTGLSMVAEEMPDPVGTEFRLAYDRQNFGMPMPEALKSLGERVPLLDARFFVTAVLTQRDAGGNLSEVLDNLAVVIRERFKVKRQVRVVTAHARITGWVLALLPPSLGVILTMLAPTHMSLLWTDPIGVKMVVVALILQVVGTLIIRKLVDVEY